MKRLMIWLTVMLVLVLSFNVLAVSEDECVAGGGEWIIPLNIDVREGDQRLPFCQCEQGHQWDGTTCLSIPTEILCESSDGVWAGESCQCPEESIGWNDRIGCDYRENLGSTVVAERNSKSGSTPVIILSLLLLFAILIYLLSRKKKKRKGENQHEK